MQQEMNECISYTTLTLSLIYIPWSNVSPFDIFISNNQQTLTPHCSQNRENEKNVDVAQMLHLKKMRKTA
ncbi:hypothetical protein QVD17_33755 [Tagetes erecta]|uniref:Uncharacterized protein n=1 Tax=Tagetes erecta TaxID=13708 RepID=A0AAD8NK20_TARER|nr:hypothetical protein QVD17_33755 [Tagetes erecta]